MIICIANIPWYNLHVEEHETILKDLSILRILYDVVSPLMRATFPLGPYRVFRKIGFLATTLKGTRLRCPSG